MPITDFQRRLLRLLRTHRNPNSYVAGGIAIHRQSNSARYSHDVDFFHDIDEAVTLSARADLQVLEEESYELKILIEQPSFIRAVVSKGSESVKLEWVRDTSFRFFPVIPDEELGYRLHDIDLAVNKCLALANRNEVRDIVDVVQLHERVIPLPAAIWAACGKDPGFTPDLMIDCMRRRSLIRSEQLEGEALVQPVDPVELKRRWMGMLEEVKDVIRHWPPQDLGCIYVDSRGECVGAPAERDLPQVHQHFGVVGGSWPRVIRV